MSGAAMPTRIEVPVLIVGAGPVGLVLAADLGWRGVRCLQIDQSDGTMLFPASEAIFVRTMEHLRRLGVAEAVRAAPFPADYPRNIVFATRVAGRLITRFERDSNGSAFAKAGRFSPEAAMWCPKMWFDPILEQYARRQPSVEVRRGWRLESFRQDPDGIIASVVPSDDAPPIEVHAKYLLACDGGRSTVRRQLGIEFDGRFAEGHNYSIYFRSQELLERQPHGRASQFLTLCSRHRSSLSTVNGRDLWRLSLYVSDEESKALDPMACIRDAVGAPIEAEVLRAQTWYGHRVVAQRYRDGRVFLVGDAAHMLWPKGGFGANTGIGDATDLAWMIEAVLAGWGGERLLDAYDAERRPIGTRNVTEASSNRAADGNLPSEELLDAEGPAGEACRAALAETIQRTRWKEWNTLGIQLGYRYSASPVIAYDGSTPPPDDPSDYVPSSCPGCRAPHAWLSPRRSTLDLFGRGYVLLDFGAGPAAAALAAAAQRIGMPLNICVIDDPAVAALYERRLVLVRPDGHVAWRGDTLPQRPGELVDLVRGATVSAAAAAPHSSEVAA